MFYKTGVDIASVKSMWEFLHDHFTYFTLNSWNGLRSIAHNVKLYNLSLSGDWIEVLKYLEDESDSGGLQFEISDAIREFETEWKGYTIGFNGRSGGYIVLYSERNSGHILPDWIYDYENYEDFKQDTKDYGYILKDYLKELREYTELVRAFDKLCDQLRDLVDEYSKHNYNVDKLNYAVMLFEERYGYDLSLLGITNVPMVVEDYIDLRDIGSYVSLTECLLSCIGSQDRARVMIEDNKLRLN